MHARRALPDLLRVGFAGTVAYRAELVIWILTATLPLIMLAMWTSVAAEGPVQGFGELDLARYFVVTLVVRQATSLWLVWEINEEIRTGALSGRLLKPLHPFWVYGTNMMVALPLRLVVLTPIVLLMLLWMPGLLVWPGLAALGLGLVAMLVALALNFLLQASFGCLSFWLDKTDGLFAVWFSVWMLLSGYVAPLAFFPPSLRESLRYLPFHGMMGLPVELLGGFLSPQDALLPLLAQLGWTVFFVLLARFAWTRGLARYGAFGA